LQFVIISNDEPALFAVAPAISAAGVLTFTPARGRCWNGDDLTAPAG
jgi:hypothetical protein